METNRLDSKSRTRKGIRVRFPAPAPLYRAFVSECDDEVMTRLSGACRITVLGLILAAILAPPAAALDLELITPCRLYDTRTVLAEWGGKLRPDDIRSLGVAGRKIGECDLPKDAVGVVATVTVTDTFGAGHLKIWAVEGPPHSHVPTTVVLAWDRPGTTASAQATLKLGPWGSVWLRTYGSSTHVIIDVVGFYR